MLFFLSYQFLQFSKVFLKDEEIGESCIILNEHDRFPASNIQWTDSALQVMH